MARQEFEAVKAVIGSDGLLRIEYQPWGMREFYVISTTEDADDWDSDQIVRHVASELEIESEEENDSIEIIREDGPPENHWPEDVFDVTELAGTAC